VSGKPKKVREQVMVYLTSRDREMLERLAAETGLSRTELLRRGLWRLAGELLGESQPGSAFAYLVDKAADGDAPPDLSERPDHYLYGGGYESWKSRTKPDSPSKPRRSGRG
jgi:hypothetical protein